MPNLFLLSDQYNLILAIIKGFILIASAIGLTAWYLNLQRRSVNEKQRYLITSFSIAASFYLSLLFLDLLYPTISFSFTYPLALAFAIALANIFLLCTIIPYVDDNFYRAILRFTGFLSLAIGLFALTNPLHRIIDITFPQDDGIVHWSVNIFLYYGIACILIGFFMYFSSKNRSQEWNNGVIALGLTALLIIAIGYTLPRLLEFDLFVFLYIALLYFFLVFDLIFRSHRGPFFLKHLPIFERADILMSIVSPEGKVLYASQGLSEQLEIINELNLESILEGNGEIHILDKDDQIFQWSSHPVDNNYLITMENITELMLELREKEQQRDELERQQLVMGTQSSIDQEVERIQYRLQLLANVEIETKTSVNALQNLIRDLSGPVSRNNIQLVKILSRYIKRRSLISLENEDRFSTNWISLVAQELLDVAFETDYAVHLNPDITFNIKQLKQFQDTVLQIALGLIPETELLLSVRKIKQNPEVTLLFRSSQTNNWRDHLIALFPNQPIHEDVDSITVVVELEG